MNRDVIKKRIKAIRHQLEKKKINCFIMTNPANVTYTTGFMGADSWAVITKKQVYLLTDSRYIEQAQKECAACRIIERADSESLAEAAAKLVKKLPTWHGLPARENTAKMAVPQVIIEKSASLADFDALKKNIKVSRPGSGRARFRTIANVIEAIRSNKDRSEIAAIRTAASIAAKALKQALRAVSPGITEDELAGLLDFQIRKVGAINSFDTIIAFGPNASRPHHQPGRRKLKKSDTILIDFGAKYKGYCCDITRCFAVGRPTVFYKKAYDVVEQAQAAAIKMVKAGVEIVRVDAAAREVIRKNNLPVYGHGTGHGLGLEIHELPYVKAESKGQAAARLAGKLQAGQVITIEPGVYIPGKLGVRIEDDILITETGYKILTRSCPHNILLSI